MSVTNNPDCRNGRHEICNRTGWDEETDALTDCGCSCHHACKFCDLAELVPEENQYGAVRAILDGYPVTEGHWLIIPAEHRADYFHLSEQEYGDTDEALHDLRARLLAQDDTISGFNIGWNCGVDAGQTVMHAHAHLIPRRGGDHPKPAGGIRSVIPGKQHYKEKL